MKNIGYTHLNVSTFPYTRLYTSQKRFRKCIIKKIAFIIQKINKKVILCQTPTKAVVNSFNTTHGSWNCDISTKEMCSTSLLLHEEVTKHIGTWCDFSFISKLYGNAGNYPFCCNGTKTEIFLQLPKVSLMSIKQNSSHIKMHQLFTKVRQVCHLIPL